MVRTAARPFASPRFARSVLAAIVLLVAIGVTDRFLTSQSAAPGVGSASSAAHLLRLTEPRTIIDFSVVLRARHGTELKRTLRDVNDPRSPRYRHYLNANQYGARFGISMRRIRAARAWLRMAGFSVGLPSKLRISLPVRGSAALVSRTFGVRLADFLDAQGRRYHAPLDTPQVPRALRSAVQGVTGLSTRSVMRPEAVPAIGLRPSDLAAAYDITPLHRRGIEGQGQTVAIVSFDSSSDTDWQKFDELTGTSGPPVRRRQVKGGAPIGDGEDEVNLDIDTIRAVAPKAQIIDYEGPNGLDLKGNEAQATFAEMLEKIVADGRADIVSVSWGQCDLPEAFGDDKDEYLQKRARDTRAFAAAALRGISMFVASGDAGAYDCQREDVDNATLSVDFPAAVPSVIAVGGTRLSVRSDSSYLKEWGWEYILSEGGGGGGLSAFDRRPAWQAGPGVIKKESNGMRQIPDVAGPADPDSGVLVVSGGDINEIGGTSAAAPFWSGSMVLARQVAQRAHAGKLGFVAPILYRVARRDPGSFHDVTSGGNRYFNATKGWDFSTGLGSPDVSRLANSLADELRR